MDIDSIIQKFRDFFERKKTWPFIKEAARVLTYKTKAGYKIIHYLTATAIFMFVLIFGFIVFSFFNCFGAVNSLNAISPITIFFFFISIIAVSFILSPFFSGYYLMVYKDVFGSLDSDFSDFLFFIHSLDKNKKNFLVESFIVCFLNLFLLSIFVIVSIGFISFLLKFIPPIPVINFILAFVVKVVISVISLTFILPILPISFILITKVNERFFINPKGDEKNIEIRNVIDVILKSFKLYFSNFSVILINGFILAIGFITLVGNLVSFPLGSLGLIIALRKKM